MSDLLFLLKDALIKVFTTFLALNIIPKQLQTSHIQLVAEFLSEKKHLFVNI